MAELKKIAFVLDEFALGTPAQHLLDRFLMGYHRDGKWIKPEDRLVAISIPEEKWDAELDRRVKDFDLRKTQSLVEALEGANGVVVAGKGVEGDANDLKLKFVIERVPEGCPVFIYGAGGSDANSTGKLMAIADGRNVPLAAGSTIPVTWRLPELQIEPGAKVKRALAVVHGDFPSAEYFGLEATLPITETRAVDVLKREVGAEIRRREKRWMFTGLETWDIREDIELMMKRDNWGGLLAAALSRSNSPQGKSVEDGRTQDLSSLSAFFELGKDLRMARIVEIDGYQSMIVVANGVVEDFTLAVEYADGKMASTQIYRPPGPARNDFDRLAETIEDLFETGKAPWSFVRTFQEVSLLGIMRLHESYRKK